MPGKWDFVNLPHSWNTIDGQDGDLLTARTSGGRLVRLPGDPALIGTFADAVIDGCTTWSLTGRPAGQ